MVSRVRFIIKVILIVVVILPVASLLRAQNSERVLVVGQITDREGEPIVEADVILLKNFTEIERLKSSDKGTFGFHLELDKVYDIRVVKGGYSSKVVRLKTDVPPEARKVASFDLYEVSIWTYKMPITLFENYNNIDVDVLKDPVAMIKYDPERNEFGIDSVYHAEVKVKIEKLHKEIAVQEEEYAVVIERADSAYAEGELKLALENYNASMDIKMGVEPLKRIKELSGKISIMEKARYQELIVLADSAMKEEAYEEVEKYYMEAVDLRPKESFAKKQLDKVHVILAEIEIERHYQEIIANAVQAMGELNYDLATKYYSEALELRPSDSKPAAKLDLIDNIVNQIRIDTEYATLIKKADSMFMTNSYEWAQFYYSAALDLKPTEVYALERVLEIEETVAEIRRAEVIRIAMEEETRLAELALEEERIEEEEAKREEAAALVETEETKITEERNEETIRREIESKIAMEEQQEQLIREAEAIQAEKEKLRTLANKKQNASSLETGSVASEHTPVEHEELKTEQVIIEESTLTAEVILKNIIKKRAAEALVEIQIVEAKAIILQDEMIRETEELTFNEMQNYIAKAKSKKLFLEEIADSRRSMRIDINRNSQ